MRAYDIIDKKKRGGVLSAGEIEFLVRGFVSGDVADYQMSAWCMAVYFRGMNREEVTALTLAMARSGEQLDLSGLGGPVVDKHSSGGVGDKTTLVVGPLAAACGVKVAKMSGRGLGHTGGTIDKLESIPGLSTTLTTAAFLAQVARVGLAVIGQTHDLVPADKKIYALRDVTATVDSVPLIASSIMSKKIAGGAPAMVLDVKAGSGAFMKTVEEAEALARTLVDIGTAVGRKTRALVTDMSQPLGLAVGNALEVAEAVATLKGQGPGDLESLSVELASHMVVLAGLEPDTGHARARVRLALTSGAAFSCFEEMVAAQGGDRRCVRDPSLLPRAPVVEAAPAPASGYVAAIDAEAVGRAAQVLGAGRSRKEDQVDPSVGIVLSRKLGDRVSTGEALAQIHAPDRNRLDAAREMVLDATIIADRPPEEPQLIKAVL